MVILRRHYQFWFVATALHKLGAVMVPATFMLKEHDLEYRLNFGEIKALVCTSVGTIADVVDNVEALCPGLEVKMLVNGAGGGLSPRRKGRFCRFRLRGHLRHGLAPRSAALRASARFPSSEMAGSTSTPVCAMPRPISSAVKRLPTSPCLCLLFPLAPRAIPSWSCTTAATPWLMSSPQSPGTTCKATGA